MMAKKKSITLIEKPDFLGVQGITQTKLSLVLNDAGITGYHVHDSVWTRTIYVEFCNAKDKAKAIKALCAEFNVEEDISHG